MSPHTEAVMVLWGDISLVIVIAAYLGFAIHMARVSMRSRDIKVMLFALDRAALAIFFTWFAIVYVDRRWPELIPGNLVQMMGFVWYGPLRTMLVSTIVPLWWVLWRP